MIRKPVLLTSPKLAKNVYPTFSFHAFLAALASRYPSPNAIDNTNCYLKLFYNTQEKFLFPCVWLQRGSEFEGICSPFLCFFKEAAG